MLDIFHQAANSLKLAIAIAFQFLTQNFFRYVQDLSLNSRNMKNIVILGGSYAGISTAHRILKQAGKTGSFKITLVSQNTHFYWNMASARGLIPGQLTDEQLFQPIAPGFNRYPASQFELILASAESLDIEAKKIHLSGSTDLKILEFDFLILATGSHTKGDTPFKGLGSTKATIDSLHDFQTRIKESETIVVAGGGVTGVETVGELAFEYGRQKKVILIASGPRILEESPEGISKIATKELQNLKVDINLQTKVVGSLQMHNGQQELTLSNGGKLITDLYIPTFGLLPNSSYIPAKFLNGGGYVIVDEYLQVKGINSVWAIGDVSSVEPSQFIYCDRQSAQVAKNISLILNNKAPIPYKVATSRIIGVQLGRKAGTGSYGNIKIPSFIIIYIRKQLFMEHFEPTISGSKF